MTSPTLTAEQADSICGYARIDDWGVLRAKGDDAAKFLHGQLTQDFSLLGMSEARLAAYCSPKGRMLATFIGFKLAHDDVLLLCHRDVLTSALKRLSMFVLRAKVKLSDASPDFDLRGQVSARACETVTPWEVLPAPARGHCISLYPALGLSRTLWVVPRDTAVPEAPRLEEALWHWLDVMSGIAHVTAPLVDAFVPQMLNYESVGGVNFKKGCYPGQEVVARSQFRGTLKRRAFLVEGQAPMAVGQELFHSADAEQATGTVAACAVSPDGQWHAVVSMQVRSAQDGELRLGHAAGPLLQILPLPYALMEDI